MINPPRGEKAVFACNAGEEAVSRQHSARSDGPVALIVAAGGTVSGREIVTLLLASGLRAAGWRVVLLISSWGNGDFRARVEADGFEYHVLPLGFFSLQLRGEPLKATVAQAMLWPSLVCRYRQIVRSLAPDAVIHTDWQHVALLLPLLMPARDIYWAHEIIPDRLHYRLIFRAIARKTRWIVGVSQAVVATLERARLPPQRLKVIHNGIPQADAPAACRGSNLRLGIIGQIADWKGHDLAIEALAQVERPNVVLSVFGSGDLKYVESLRQKAVALGVSQRVYWRGFVKDRYQIYSEIDVCLVPSRFEDPLPTVAIEAGLASRPVICTRLGGLPEIVTDGVTGIHVDARGPKELAAAIRTFADDPKLVSLMGGAARERVVSEFSYARFVDRFEHLLCGIARENADA